MRMLKIFGLSLPALAAVATYSGEAAACGGCFVPQSENTQVSGHRMVLSIAQEKTTLWDQIRYVGAPSSFAWVLPTRGVVEIGLSSDAMFQDLEARTTVQVQAPQLNCGPVAFSAAESLASADEEADGVTVLAHEVVGPYETVQLSADDPAALRNWLSEHGYAVPPDVSPVIDAYVTEGFDFLALKLVPGQGIDAMRPVRVTSPGATPSLPLRMVAAGTGVTTPITLWVLGEGRYEPSSFPSFTIDERAVVWDWNTSSSNYAELRQAMFDATWGRGWLIEAGEPLSPFALQQSLVSLATNDASGSGYADANGAGAVEAAQADVDALIGGIAPASLWVTRLYAQLSRDALATDLLVQASADQSVVARSLVARSSRGPSPCAIVTPPPRPPPTSIFDETTGGAPLPPNPSGSCGADSDAPGASPGNGDDESERQRRRSDSSCALGARVTPELLGAGWIGALVALAARRRRRPRSPGASS